MIKTIFMCFTFASDIYKDIGKFVHHRHSTSLKRNNLPVYSIKYKVNLLKTTQVKTSAAVPPSLKINIVSSKYHQIITSSKQDPIFLFFNIYPVFQTSVFKDTFYNFQNDAALLYIT